MTDLGVIVTSRATRARRGEPTDTGVAFLVDFTEWGPHDEAVEVTNFDEFQETFGERVAYSLASDSLELAFAEGLATCFVARQVGPDPVEATLELVDRAGSPLDTIAVDALYVGDRGDGISVEVIDGDVSDTFTLIVYFEDIEVERFEDLASPAAAVTASAVSDYIRVRNLGSATVAPNNNPAEAGPTNLAGGDDDHGSATITEFEAALALFSKDLGPGQVFAPGRTTLAQQTALVDHAADNNRTAYLDAPDQATRSTLVAAAAALAVLADSPAAKYLGSWFDIPSPVAGSTRAVPGSAFDVGVTARVDALEGTAGAAAAGEVSTAQYAIGVRAPADGFDKDDYNALDDAGVVMARHWRNRGVQLYGVRSVTDQDEWTQITSHRLRMSLTAKLEKVAVPFPFRRIDAKGHLFGEYNGALKAVCLEEYALGALYGETPEEAFTVDTGSTVNTDATIAAKQIRARIGAKFSPTAEQVFVELIKEPLP